VTGGSRGLGLQCALSLALEGVNVAICGRTQATFDGTVAEIEILGVRSIGIVADVSGAKVLRDSVVAGLGPLDILVNNEGIPCPLPRRAGGKLEKGRWHA